MTSSLFCLPSLPCLVPEPQRCKCGVIPREFFPCSKDFPWQADSLQLLSCAPASKPESNLKKKDKISQASGSWGFSVSVRIMWQWHSSNRNQKPCNVSPCCLDMKGEKRKREKKIARRGMLLVIGEGWLWRKSMKEKIQNVSTLKLFQYFFFTAANCQRALDHRSSINVLIHTMGYSVGYISLRCIWIRIL